MGFPRALWCTSFWLRIIVIHRWSHTAYAAPAPSSFLRTLKLRGGSLESGSGTVPLFSPPQCVVPPDEEPVLEKSPPAQTLAALVKESGTNLFFSEHGRCGAVSRKSARCVDGYAAALASNAAAGVTCALTLVPEALSLALLAGVQTEVGLWTTLVMSGTSAWTTSRGGLVTGASRATAVVAAQLIKDQGPGALPPAVLCAGLLQLLAGRCRVGKYTRLIPHPVMLGFVNGLAVVLFRAQLRHFLDPATGRLLQGPRLAASLGVAALSLGLVKLVPVLSDKAPASFVAIAASALVAKALRLPASTLGDMANCVPSCALAGGLGALPRLRPRQALGLAALGPSGGGPGGWARMAVGVLPYAATMAAVGLLESLLVLQVVDGVVDDGTRGSTTAESLSQGLANVASSLVGGLGGAASLGQSLVMLDSGGNARVGNVACFWAIAGLLVLGAPLLRQIPTASLAGVMLAVCHSTFSWSSLRLVGALDTVDLLVLGLVSVVTVWKNLAVAVLAGTVLTSLSFSWKMSTKMAKQSYLTQDVRGHDAVGGAAHSVATVHAIKGDLFFGSARTFLELFEGAERAFGSPALVFIDFAAARVLDHSGVEAIWAVCAKLGRAGKKVVLRHLSPDCAQLLRKMDGKRQVAPPYRVVETSLSDPSYASALDNPDKFKPEWRPRSATDDPEL